MDYVTLHLCASSEEASKFKAALVAKHGRPE